VDAALHRGDVLGRTFDGADADHFAAVSAGEVRAFFFEKKNQKTFIRLLVAWHGRKVGKSFCFFFFRKRRLLEQKPT
jgi:hypothetical protein